MLKRVKVFGDFIYPKCKKVRGVRVCKEKGTYKFRSYHYIWIDDKTPTTF